MKSKVKVLLVTAALITGCGQNSSNVSDVEETSTTSTTTIITQEDTTETQITSETSMVSNNRKTNVRDFCWGDTKAIVKEVEKSKLLEETEDVLLYEVELCGYTAQMQLLFDKNYGLYDVYYILDDSGGVQESVVLNKYNDIVGRISEKYGSPSHKESVLNSLADYCDSTAQAIALGYVIVSDEWTSQDNTNITGGITCIDYKVVAIFEFGSTDFDKPRAEAGF